MLFKTPKIGVATGVATFVIGLFVRGLFGEPNWFRASLIAAVIAILVPVALTQLETLWIWRNRHATRLQEANNLIAEMKAAAAAQLPPASTDARPSTDVTAQHDSSEGEPPRTTSSTSSSHDESDSQITRGRLPGSARAAYDIRQSTAEFHARMCDAFPGVSGLCVEADKEAVAERLGVLLRQPLGDDRSHSPIWEPRLRHLCDCQLPERRV